MRQLLFWVAEKSENENDAHRKTWPQSYGRLTNNEIVQVGGGFPPAWVAMGVYEGAVALGVGAAIGGVAGKLYKKYFAWYFIPPSNWH